MAREAQIQQALERLERLFHKGEISQPLYERKKQELLTQLPYNPFSQTPLPLSSESLEHSGHQTGPFPGDLPGDFPPIKPVSFTSTAGDVLFPSRDDAVQSKMVQSNPPPRSTFPKNAQGSFAGGKRSRHGAQELPPMGQGKMIRQRYRVKSHLGEGSIGHIFLVEDTQFGGTYALKRLHTRLTQNTEEMKRWVAAFYEHQRLKHPGVVRTYLIDEDPAQDVLFYIREYVVGESLQKVFEQSTEGESGTFSIKEALRIFQSLVNLVHEAHDNDFYILDLNPNNIIFPRDVDDSPIKLLDFHFSGHLGQTTQHLNLKSRKTLYYTAPELISGSDQKPTKESNIFALGALLYQMLTGTLPIAMAVAPSQINPALPKEVDQVLQHSMHPQFQHRYHTLEEMVDDLYEAFTPTEHKIQTPPPKDKSATERDEPTPRWATDSSKPKAAFQNPFKTGVPPTPAPNNKKPSNHPNKKSQLPSTPGSFSGPVRYTPPTAYHKQFPALPGVSPSRNDSSHPHISRSTQPKYHRSAPPETPRAKERRNLERGLNSPSSMARNMGIPQRSGIDSQRGAISNAERIARLRSGKQTPEPETVRDDLPKTPPKEKLLGHKKGLTSLSISPDGRFLASASHDGTVCLWDTQSWYTLYNIEVESGTPEHLCWNPQREMFAYSTAGNILVHDLRQREWRWQIATGTTCRGLAWHPTTMSLLVALADGTLCWWSLDTEEPSPQATLRAPSIHALALHSQRQFVVAGDSAGQLSCWRGSDKNPTWQPPSLGSGINVISCFPTQRKTLVGDREGMLHIFDLAQKTQERSWQAHKKGVRALVIPPHEKWFASCSNDQRIHLWSLDQEEPLCTLSGRQGALRALALSPEGDWMASGGEESSVCIWDTSLWN